MMTAGRNVNRNQSPDTAPNIYDIAVIGGGVNGTAIARDAAGRGYGVVVFEKGDLGGATSSASSKLIHGGLRYLEQGQIGLVKKALAEREVMLRTAPHIVAPLRFVLPLTEKGRPSWMVRLGLGLYDRLARRDVLPGSEHIRNPEHVFRTTLAAPLRDCFAYSDCWVDDARLVILQALDARRQGARIYTRTGLRDITPADGGWEIETQTDLRVRARVVVNAAGPWVRRVLEDNALDAPNTPKLRLVRGSHIVVPRLHEGEQAYILPQPDGRIVFALPYEDRFTLIGTTEVDHDGGPDVKPECTPEEAAYLCDAINRYFPARTTSADIVWLYSGVRPLFDDGHGNPTAVTRDSHLHMATHGGNVMLSVFGGKITTARVLAEQVTAALEKTLGRRAGPWTAIATLPGGDMPEADFPEFLGDMAALYPWFEADALYRCARAYGTRLGMILGSATKPEQLGRDFGGGLFEAELDYLRREEWAQTAEDVLWRRTKLGLHASAPTIEALKRYMGE